MAFLPLFDVQHYTDTGNTERGRGSWYATKIPAGIGLRDLLCILNTWLLERPQKQKRKNVLLLWSELYLSQILIPLSHSPKLSISHQETLQFQLWRLFQSTSCCYTNFTALFKNLSKMPWKMLWRQLVQGWTDELCWEQTLSLKS